MIMNNGSNEHSLVDNELIEGRVESEKNLTNTVEMLHILEAADEEQDGAASIDEIIDDKQGEKAMRTAIMPEETKRERQGNISKENIKKESPEEYLYGKGLLHYKKFWYHNHVDINVNGELISGIPLLMEHNILHVINEHYNYFIPVDKVDYIRTPDGLKAINNPKI